MLRGGGFGPSPFSCKQRGEQGMSAELHVVTPADHQVLKNLLEYYLYEFSGYRDDIELNKQGYFGFQGYEQFLSEPFTTFFITVHENLAGFAIVEEKFSTNRDRCYCIREFFVVRKYRRRGIGKQVAWEIFNQFRGVWDICQIKANVRAQTFWRSIVSEYTNGDYTEIIDENGKVYQIFYNGKTPKYGFSSKIREMVRDK